MRIRRSVSESVRTGLVLQERWHAEDRGLIACWERGRELALQKAELAEQAKRGELLLLPWRGGVERALKSGRKYGSLRYLAMWQGLRGEDLDIHLDIEREIVCTRHATTVFFTADQSKYAAVAEDA